MQPDTLFRMSSMTKPITAAATMMLWEQGKLELTDPVSWYISTFRNQMVDAAGKLVPAERELILQDLLNMTSGIPYPDCHTLSQKKMGAFYDEINTRLSTDHPVDTQEFAMRVGKDVPLLFQPGTRWSYGASADILGAVLEHISDLPLDELFRKLIFTPLGMKDTDFYVPKEKRPRLAQLYAWGKNGRHFSPAAPALFPPCRTMHSLLMRWPERVCTKLVAHGFLEKAPGAISPHRSCPPDKKQESTGRSSRGIPMETCSGF